MIFAQTIVNIVYDYKFFIKNIQAFDSPNRHFPPGEPYFLLRPFLKQIAEAGYYIDRDSVNPGIDPKVMWHYQQAQNALSPTLLHFFGARSYEYIVFQCENPEIADERMQAIGFKPVIVLKNGIGLARRYSR